MGSKKYTLTHNEAFKLHELMVSLAVTTEDWIGDGRKVNKSVLRFLKLLTKKTGRPIPVWIANRLAARKQGQYEL